MIGLLYLDQVSTDINVIAHPVYWQPWSSFYLTATSMERDQKEALFHTPAFNTAGAALMTFKPIDAIHQHLCAFHVYS
jgi:hypothetical protein